MLQVALGLLVGVVTAGDDGKTAGFTDFSERPIPLAAEFRFGPNLSCEVVIATIPNSSGRRFTLSGADTDKVGRVWSDSPRGQHIPRIHNDAQRTVFQLANEDPGSVDTLSLDKVTGAYSRTWSGWGGRDLVAGGERGRCAPKAPAATRHEDAR